MLVILIMILLALEALCQHEVTEKSLDKILDQLIEETIVDTFSNENINNSRIIYLKPEDIASRRTQDSRLKTSIHSSEYEDLEDLVHQMGYLKNTPDSLKENRERNSVIKQITVEIEQSLYKNNQKDGDSIQELQIVNNGFTQSGRPLYEEIVDSSIENYSAKHGSAHKYPEVTIEKISYDANDNNNNQNVERDEPINSDNIVKINSTNVDNLKEVQKEVAAKALGSFLRLLIKEVPQRKPIQIPLEYAEQDDISAVLSSARRHDSYHNQMINDVPLAYRSFSTHGKMLLGKLPERYHGLDPMFNGPSSVYLDPNFQLNGWRRNVRPNPIMNIPRSHQLNHVHFIRKPLNIVPRILYQPLYQPHRYLNRY